MSIGVRAVYKIKDKQGRVIGYTLQSENNEMVAVKADILKNKMLTGEIVVVNLRLTSSGRIVGNNCTIPTIIQDKTSTSSRVDTSEQYNYKINCLTAQLADANEQIDELKRQLKNAKCQVTRTKRKINTSIRNDAEPLNKLDYTDISLLNEYKSIGPPSVIRRILEGAQEFKDDTIENENKELKKELTMIKKQLKANQSSSGEIEKLRKVNKQIQGQLETLDKNVNRLKKENKELLGKVEDTEKKLQNSIEKEHKIQANCRQKISDTYLSEYNNTLRALGKALADDTSSITDCLVDQASKAGLYVRQLYTACGNTVYIIDNEAEEGEGDITVIIPDDVQDIGEESTNEINNIQTKNIVKVIGGRGLLRADNLFNTCEYIINASNLHLKNVGCAVNIFRNTKVKGLKTNNKVILNEMKS